MSRKYFYLMAASIAAAGLLISGAAMAALDVQDDPLAIAAIIGEPPADGDALHCEADRVPAYAVEVLFTESVDLKLCEPALFAATGDCLAAVNFGADTDDLIVVGIRLLGCAESGRSPPG